MVWQDDTGVMPSDDCPGSGVSAGEVQIVRKDDTGVMPSDDCPGSGVSAGEDSLVPPVLVDRA